MSWTDLALVFVVVLVFTRQGLRARLARSSAAPVPARRFLAAWFGWSILFTALIAFAVQIAIGIGSFRIIAAQLGGRH